MNNGWVASSSSTLPSLDLWKHTDTACFPELAEQLHAWFNWVKHYSPGASFCRAFLHYLFFSDMKFSFLIKIFWVFLHWSRIKRRQLTRSTSCIQSGDVKLSTIYSCLFSWILSEQQRKKCSKEGASFYIGSEIWIECK